MHLAFAGNRGRASRAVVELPPVGPWTRAILWHGLAGPETLPRSPITQELDTILQQRLAPLALDLFAGHDAPPAPVMAALRHSDFFWNTLSTSVMKSGHSVMRTLDSAGIPSLYFKGQSIRESYRVPRHRVFSDVDLLVRRGDYKRARGLLNSVGWQEELRSQMPYDAMNVLCREAQNLKRGPGESVDLHHQIPPWLWTNRIRFDDVLADTRVSSAGRAMSPEWNLLVSSLHLVSDKSKPGQTLIIWRDLAELSRVVDENRLVELAGSTGLTGWLRAILRAMPEPVRPQPLIDRLRDGRILHRRRLSLLSNSTLVVSRAPLVQLFRLPTPRAVLFAAGMAFPSPGLMNRRYGGPFTGYRAWWTGRE